MNQNTAIIEQKFPQAASESKKRIVWPQTKHIQFFRYKTFTTKKVVINLQS